FVAGKKSLATHEFVDVPTTLRWLQTQLAKTAREQRRLYFMPAADDDIGLLAITAAQYKTLRSAGLPITEDLPRPSGRRAVRIAKPKPKQKPAQKIEPKRTADPLDDLEAALTSSGVVTGATAAQLKAARKAVSDPDADDAAYKFLQALPAKQRPCFVLCE